MGGAQGAGMRLPIAARTPAGWANSIGRLKWLWRSIAVLVIVGGLICLIDVLALTARDAVAAHDHSWWGEQETEQGSARPLGPLGQRWPGPGG